MYRILLVLLVVTMHFHGNRAASVKIYPPIRDKGEEASLIFIPGADISGEAYYKTARAIQEASQMRLWVALTGNYTAQLPNPIELPAAVEEATKELKARGMVGGHHVGLGHSLGGVFLASYAPISPLSAVVLLGAYINRGTSLTSYAKPVLTLSGELDGQTRISRVAVDYQQLKASLPKHPQFIYTKPVINIKGSNHGQFASGPMPPTVKKYDIKPDVSNAHAHADIGRHVSNFITALLSNETVAVNESRRQLVEAHADSGKRFQPLIDIKAFDHNADDTSSTWARNAQALIVFDLAPKIKNVTNSIHDYVVFLICKPSIKPVSGGVHIYTYTMLEYQANPLDISTTPESPRTVYVKMKSREAILKALNQSEAATVKRAPINQTCIGLNKIALQLALVESTDEARKRYMTRGRQVSFLDDLVFNNGGQWEGTNLTLHEDDQGLHIRSSALYTTLDNILFPGEHYCKIISPYRAMEWINIDSLREHKP